MDVEIVTDLLLQGILGDHDPQARGAFVEVGLGTINYSFLWARDLGFTCYGVEPLPSEKLKESARLRGVDLMEAAISTVNGTLPIHVGMLDGFTVSDVSSLHPDWWGGGTQTKMVRSIRLCDYLSEKRIARISCLKIDTEGSEPSIVCPLVDLNPVHLPKVVAFEYGGGGSRASGSGGWKPGFFRGTLDCLETLKRLGYSWMLVAEASASRTQVIRFDSVANFEPMFPDTATVGNLICLREDIPLDEVHRLIKNIRLRVLLSACSKGAQSIFSSCWYYVGRIVSGIGRRLARLGGGAKKP